MCTVTYIPKGEDAFILTSNRDEQSSRNAKVTPAITLGEQKKLLFPKDPPTGGTWMAVSDQNQAVCLLNGAFEKHKHRPPYQMSRGLVVLEFFEYPNGQAFLKTFDFTGIEPFTMVIYDRGTLIEFRWDGNDKHVKILSPSEPHIWSSVTLYDPTMIKERHLWFEEWLQQDREKNIEQVLQFHQFGGNGNLEYGYIMNRENIVQTLSITGLVKDPGSVTMIHEDLINQTKSQQSIELRQKKLEAN